MKIALVELDCHIECLYSFCQLLQNSDYIVSIYTKNSIYNELKHNIDSTFFNWKIWDEKSSESKFLQDHKKSLNNNDFIFFLTIQTKFKSYNIPLKPITILRVHNVHTFLNPRHNWVIKLTPYYLWKFFSYIVRELGLRRERYHLLRLLTRIDYLTFSDTPIHNYVINNRLNGSTKLAPVIPLAVFSDNDVAIAPKLKDTLRIVTPGRIDKRRRDYMLLFRGIQKFLERTSNKKIELIFLGPISKIYGKKIIRRFKKLSQKRIHVISFSGRVSQTEFLKYIKLAHIMVSPLFVETTYRIYKEIYGKTKISGVISDVIRYGKPAFITKNYQISSEFKGAILQFSNSHELCNLLIEITNPNNMIKLYDNLNNVLTFYKPKNILKNLENFFNQHE